MIEAGAASVDITPSLNCHLMGFVRDRIAIDVHDKLFSKAIVLSSGRMTLGLIVCDLAVITGTVADGAKARIEKLSGVPASNILICGTHTHTGPAVDSAFLTPKEDSYAEWVVGRIADSFMLAYRRLQPAQIAHSSGNCASEVYNRRYRMKNGSVEMNPGYQNPDIIEPAGPVDPELGLMFLRTPALRPIAVFASLALHYVGSREPDTVSSDYFGAFAEALQRCAGEQFTVALSNGCSGDINNIDVSQPPPVFPHPYYHIDRVGNVVAGDAWKVWNCLRENKFVSDVRLDARLERIPFDARMPSERELEEAESRMKAERDETNMDWVYSREILLMSRSRPISSVPIQAMRIGDLCIVGLPGEVFVDVGLEIKKRSPFRRTLTVGLANSWVGYVATDRALEEGSYETRLCRHVRAAKGTARTWADVAVGLLRDMNDE